MKRVCVLAAALLLLTGCSGSAQQREYDDGWRDAYAKILRGTTAKRFSLVYVDNDDIPELTLHWSDEGLASREDHPAFYIYNSTGEAENMGSSGDGGFDRFSYLERKGIILSGYSDAGARFANYMRLENDSLTAEHELRYDESGCIVIAGDGFGGNGDAVAAHYEKQDLRTTTGEYPVSEDNILNIVMGQ